MFCKNCGKNLPDGAAFCSNCGTPANGVKTAIPVQPVYAEPEAVQVRTVRKKKTGLIIFIIFIIIAMLSICAAVAAPRMLAENKKSKLKTYDCGSFTIDLPEDMEKNVNSYKMGNGTVFLAYNKFENMTGMKEKELAEALVGQIEKNEYASNVSRSGNTITYTRHDNSGIDYFEMLKVYSSGDDVIGITLAGKESSKSYFKELFDTVVIK